MTLTQLLASTSDEDLARLSKEHVRTDEPVSRAQLSHMLESAVRSYSFVHDFVTNRQPPTFAMLSILLDSPNHTLPFSGFYEKAMGETMRLAALAAWRISTICSRVAFIGISFSILYSLAIISTA